MLFGALEAGGTKMVCAVGDENGKILERVRFPTTTPEETIPPMIDYFRDRKIDALGIACFGPIDLNPGSSMYGHILKTPKPGWQYCAVVRMFTDALNVPAGFDVDVNGSLLGEVTYGAAKGKQNAVYYTVGTGIGAGIMTGGKLLHGMQHAEAGHILVRRVPGDDFKGSCPSHGDCLEGLASGPAIEARWGEKAEFLSGRSEVWELESEYLAQAVMTTVLTVSPEIIILGGGVMEQRQLFPLIRKKTLAMLNGYLDTAQLRDIDHYVVPSALNGDQGILGCFELARNAFTAQELQP